MSVTDCWSSNSVMHGNFVHQHLMAKASCRDVVTKALLEELAMQEQCCTSAQSEVPAYLSQVLSSSCQLLLFQPAEIDHVQAGGERLRNP